MRSRVTLNARPTSSSVNGRAPVEFYGRTGGVIPTPEEVLGAIRRVVEKEGGR